MRQFTDYKRLRSQGGVPSVYIYIYIYMYVCMYMYVCVYIYIYIYVSICIMTHYISYKAPASGRGRDKRGVHSRGTACLTLITCLIRYHLSITCLWYFPLGNNPAHTLYSGSALRNPHKNCAARKKAGGSLQTKK